MVSAFLRLFALFRATEREVKDLREALAEANHERHLLQDRLLSAQEDKKQLWELVHSSIEGERFAYQTHVNISMQKLGAGVPYPDAHHLPPQSVPVPAGGAVGRRGRMLPSELVQQEIHRFAEEVIAKR